MLARILTSSIDKSPVPYIAQTRHLAAEALDRNGVPGAWRQGRPRHYAVNHFVRELALLYSMLTGRKPGRSMSAGAYATPSGPFNRFVRAAFALAGEELSASRADQLIKEHARDVVKTKRSKT